MNLFNMERKKKKRIIWNKDTEGGVVKKCSPFRCLKAKGGRFEELGRNSELGLKGV